MITQRQDGTPSEEWITLVFSSFCGLKWQN